MEQCRCQMNSFQFQNEAVIGSANDKVDEDDVDKVVVCEYAKYEAKCERRRPESVCLHYCHYLQPTSALSALQWPPRFCTL